LEGHVYIIGQIGSDQNSKGVEIQDVVSKVESMKDFERIFVHIDSHGGFVDVGNAIFDYLKTKSNVYTIAENVCMSIATKIHLSAPIEKRFVQEGTKYLIHNPLFQNVSGNADELIQMAESLKPTQNELLKMYVEETGISKEAVSGLMNQEAFISEEQLVEMNFASKILPKKELKAVAFFNTNEKNNKMSKFKIQALKTMASALGVDLSELTKADANEGREAVALMIETDGGTLETPFSDLMVGDPVLIEGVQAPAGTYVSSVDGMTIVIDENGMISEIIPAEEETEDVEAMKEEIANLKAENESLKAEKETLNSQIETSKNEKEEVLASIEAMKKIQSKFVPKTANRVVNSKGKTEVLSLKERIAIRKEQSKK
jgi:ATP-dependent protease ClpP protease subunit